MKKLPTFYYDETWLENFWFCIGWTREEFTEYVKKEFNHDANVGQSQGKTLSVVNDRGHRLIIWTSHRGGRKMYETLAHEAVHAGMFCLTRVGVTVTPENDEPLAYLVSLIMRKALR